MSTKREKINLMVKPSTCEGRRKLKDNLLNFTELKVSKYMQISTRKRTVAYNSLPNRTKYGVPKQ